MLSFFAAMRQLAYGAQREGQGLLEYTFVLVLVSTALIAILALLGGQLYIIYSDIQARLSY